MSTFHSIHSFIVFFIILHVTLQSNCCNTVLRCRVCSKAYKMKGKTKYKYSVHDHDVITLRGGAAQQTTHPGNLTLYKLCEERYAEWFEALDGSPVGALKSKVGASKSKSGANDGAGSASVSVSGSGSSGAKQYRKGICLEIVRTIQKQGGTFRDGSGRTMSDERAVIKTHDRMRQIAKPKVAPPKTVHGGGDRNMNTDININMDVVFKPGGANHLYPGNAKWRFLMDGYCTRYFPELFPVQVQEGPASVPVPATESSSKSEGIGEHENNVPVPVPVSVPVPDGNKTKRLTPDQKKIQNEIIDITHERGGIFRGANLKELPREATLQKIHGRFKDMKKMIKAGKWHLDDSNCVNESKYILKKSGCTSTKLTVADIESARNRKVYVDVNVDVDVDQKMITGTCREKVQCREEGESEMINNNEDEDEDELSLSSDDGEESGSESESELDNSESEDRIPKINKKEQNEARSARLRRRRVEQENTAGDDQPQTKRHRHRRRKRKQNQKRGDCHHGRDHTKVFVPASDAKLKEMSEYERLRYEKMQRNHNRLSELGLLGGISRKL